MAAYEISKRDSSIIGPAFDNLEPHPTASMQKSYAVNRPCEMGANVLALDESGNNVAHLLVTTEQVSANEVRPVVIAKCPALVHQKNQQNETPFHLAAKDRKWDLVRTLLDSGADPLTLDSKGNTILHHLARCLREQQYVNSLHPGSLADNFGTSTESGRAFQDFSTREWVLTRTMTMAKHLYSNISAA